LFDAVVAGGHNGAAEADNDLLPGVVDITDDSSIADSEFIAVRR
jgi:hypothetical protein